MATVLIAVEAALPVFQFVILVYQDSLLLEEYAEPVLAIVKLVLQTLTLVVLASMGLTYQAGSV